MTYVGIPFEKFGRTENGLDCLGLIILWYQQNYGLGIPDVVKIDSPQEGKDLLQKNLWEEVVEPKYGDLIFMKTAHLGICLGNKKVLHTTRKTNAVIERYDRSPIKERIIGFYRRKAN